MTFLRGLLAIAAGLVIGALCAFVVIVGGDLLDPGSLRLVPFVVTAGVVLGGPGWVVACLIVLPVVTHRARLRDTPALVPYAATAAAVGVIAALPTGLVLAAFDAGILKILLTGGIAGGLAIALLWRWLILNPIAARRDVSNGAFLG